MFDYEKLTNEQLKMLDDTLECPYVEYSSLDCECCEWNNGDYCKIRETWVNVYNEILKRKNAQLLTNQEIDAIIRYKLKKEIKKRGN